MLFLICYVNVALEGFTLKIEGWIDGSMTYSPKQIAEFFKVSTTTLRRYEDQGLIPDVPRTESNHRYYTKLHFQAFITVRALLQGYEIPIVYEVMRKIKARDFNSAIWLINVQQYEMEKEKKRVEKILAMVKHADFTIHAKVKDSMSIGEVADIAGVNTSAIRHWENEGLIDSKRDKNNGYRIYSTTELRKILLISSLRKTIYYIENMRELLDELDTQNLEKLEQAYTLALGNLNEKLQVQFAGIAELSNYINMLKTI